MRDSNAIRKVVSRQMGNTWLNRDCRYLSQYRRKPARSKPMIQGLEAPSALKAEARAEKRELADTALAIISPNPSGKSQVFSIERESQGDYKLGI